MSENRPFRLVSDFVPTGDQPAAIDRFGVLLVHSWAVLRDLEGCPQTGQGCSKFVRNIRTEAPLGPEHEVVDNELAPAGEQVRKRLGTARALEHVLLLDLLPRQLAPLPAQFVANPAELLFLRQQFFALRDPILIGNHLVIRHGVPPRLRPF